VIESVTRIGFITIMGVVLTVIAFYGMIAYIIVPACDWWDERKRRRDAIRQQKERTLFEGPVDPTVRAQYLLMRLLRDFKSRDEAIQHLYYIDPDNESTRLLSIAAAVHLLYKEGR
jgi:hypothetical protein